MHNTQRTKGSTSRTESVEPKVAERGRCSEWQVQQRRSTVHSAPDYNSVPKSTGIERLAHTTSGRKPLVTQLRVAPNIRPFIHLPPRQANRRVLARTLISEYDTQMLRLRCRSELSHESPLRNGDYAGYRRAKKSRQTKFFGEDGGSAFLVARYTPRDRKSYLLEMLTYYDSGHCSLFAGFSFCLF